MNDRIYIPVSDETISGIIKLAKKQNRSIAKTASILLERGLQEALDEQNRLEANKFLSSK